jgi:hypothetical protein
MAAPTSAPLSLLLRPASFSPASAPKILPIMIVLSKFSPLPNEPWPAPVPPFEVGVVSQLTAGNSATRRSSGDFFGGFPIKSPIGTTLVMLGSWIERWPADPPKGR